MKNLDGLLDIWQFLVFISLFLQNVFFKVYSIMTAYVNKKLENIL
jgi:hypothetical protein